jgi:hypothetical protein
MIGRVEETSASFEARTAPRLYPTAGPARETGKDAKDLPPRKHKTDTDVAEKEPRSQKSAEALVRATLAKVDANSPADPEIANVQADGGPRSVDVPRAAAINAAPHAAGTDPQRPSLDVLSSPVTSVDIEPRPVAALDPLLPSASPPLEKAPPQAPPPADQDKQVRAGALTCDVSADMGLILGSQKQVSCSLQARGLLWFDHQVWA